MPLEGPVICGLRVYGQAQGYAGAGQCTDDGDSTPLVVNLKWIPYVMSYGAADELVPFAGGQEQIARFRRLGYRFYAVDYPAEDHMVFSVQNDFTPADSRLGNFARVRNPGSFTFTWDPNLVGTIDHAGQAGRIGPTGDYWVSGLAARAANPGALSTVVADSRMIRQPRQPAETPAQAVGVSPYPEPTPAAIDVERWTAGPAAATRQRVTLAFTNVAAVAIDAVRAGLRCGTVSVTTCSRGQRRDPAPAVEDGAPLLGVYASRACPRRGALRSRRPARPRLTRLLRL